MVARLESVDEEKFSLNGIHYPKVYVPVKVSVTHLKIVSVYDSKYTLHKNIHFQDVTINDNTYESLEALFQDLTPLVYARSRIQTIVQPGEPEDVGNPAQDYLDQLNFEIE